MESIDMERIFALIFFASLFFTRMSHAEGSNWEIKDNCDVPSESLKTIKSVSQDECQRNCDSDNTCKGFVYITGCNRCLLKDQMNKQAKLQFISGEMDEKHSF